MHSLSARRNGSASPVFSDFTPDVLLPVQFNDINSRRRALDGEFKLMFAVLEDAIYCYLRSMNGRTRREHEEFEEVVNWFNTFDRNGRGGGGLFAFEPLCEALGIEPHRLRERLAAIRMMQRPGVKRFRRAHRALGGLAQPTVRSSSR
jgi:hypothetical protein